MGLRNSAYNLTESSLRLVDDVSTVSNLRAEMIETKKEIIRTPMVREIVETVFNDDHPPKYILINAKGIFAKVYDYESNTYHPNGICLYHPEVTFDYMVSVTILDIFMDLYPGVYDIRKATVQEINQEIRDNNWSIWLTMKGEYMYKSATPAFNIADAASTPVDELPLRVEDTVVKNSQSMSVISLAFGVASIVTAFLGYGFIFSVISIITGIIGIRTNPIGKRKKAVWGIVLALASWVIGFIMMIIGFNAQLKALFPF